MRQETTKITIRVTPDEYAAVQVEAKTRGQSVSGYAKHRVLGRSVRPSPTMAACAELLASAYALQSLSNSVPAGLELGEEARKHARLAIAIIQSCQVSAVR